VLPSDCLTAVRTSHALGADVRDGEITDPDAYGFGTNFYAAEWQTMLRAVADAVGGCADGSAGAGAGTGADGTGTGDETATAQGDARALPATGGTGAAALVLLAAAALAARARRLGRT
jgi:hypothetical protein